MSEFLFFRLVNLFANDCKRECKIGGLLIVRNVRIMRIGGSNNDQLGDTQAILEAQLDDTIGDIGDASKGCRVKALIKSH